MKRIILVLSGLLVVTSALAAWVTDAERSRTYTAPLGTPSSAPVDTINNRKICMAAIPNETGVSAPFQCREVTDPPPPPPPPPSEVLWQTSFNIPDWTQQGGTPGSDAALAPDGDGISQYGGFPTLSGSWDVINASGNRSGSAGKGYRHAIGDGSNNGGGAILITFPAVSEFWMRWYVRYPLGFKWSDPGDFGDLVFNKQIYTLMPGGAQIFGGLVWGAVGFNVQGDPVDHGQGAGNHMSNLTWRAAYGGGGTTSLGQWHLMELHVKINQNAGVSDGVIEFKFDGQLIYSRTGIRIATVNGVKVSQIRIGENHCCPANGKDVYQDFDDIAVSNTGWIGQ